MIARNPVAVPPDDTKRFAALLDRGERRLSRLSFSELRGLALEKTVQMPANNLTVIFRMRR